MASAILPYLPYEMLLQLSALLLIDDPASLLALERTCQSLRTFFMSSGIYDDALRHIRLIGLPDPSPMSEKREYFRICFTDVCYRCGNSSAPFVRLWFFKSVLCEACATDDEIWTTRDEVLEREALGPKGHIMVSKGHEDDDMGVWRTALLGLPLQAHTAPHLDEYVMYRRADVESAILECVRAAETNNISKWFVQKLQENRGLSAEISKCFKRDKILQDWTDKTKAALLTAKLVRDYPEKFGDTSEEVLQMCPSFLRYARRSLHSLHHDPDVLREEYKAMTEALVREVVGEQFKARAVEAFDLAEVRLQPDQVGEVRKLFYCKICREERPEERIKPFMNVKDIDRHRIRVHGEAKQRACFGGIRDVWETL